MFLFYFKKIRIESVLAKTVDGKESLPSTKFNCKYLAMSSIHLPRKLMKNYKEDNLMKFIARCVLITDRSIGTKNNLKEMKAKTSMENEEESSTNEEVNENN